VLSLALVPAIILAMAVIWLPITSLASIVTVSTESQLSAAVSKEGVDEYVELGTDIDNITAELTIWRDITLDLKGFSLTIILEDSVARNSNGITIAPGVTLTIMDSIGGGQLNVTNGASSGTFAGRGAAINVTDGTLIIEGGIIKARGGFNSAGIGGGSNVSGGVITINGGTVEAYGGFDGAGIGGGVGGNGGTITINGGTVEATGGLNGAGIGGGANSNGGVITISGGTITAIAGGVNAAAIGEGSGGLNSGMISITGTYDYWVNTINADPGNEPTSGEFVCDNDLSYIKLVYLPTPVLTQVSSVRTSISHATVEFSSTIDGNYYYKVIGAADTDLLVVDVVTSDTKVAMIAGENTISLNDLTDADARKICIVGENRGGALSNVLIINISKHVESSGSGTKPGGDIIVDPDPEADPEPEVKVSIPELHSIWAREELERALELDIIPESLLDPEIDLRRPISRVEFAGVAIKAYENLADLIVLPAEENPFTDTQDEDVLRAFSVGIMVGFSKTIFSPDTELTREQAATALTRVFKRATMLGWSFETDADYPLEFTQPEPFDDDKDISVWARESVYFMAANEIILGIGNNLFAPRAVTSVQQAAGYAIATREQAILLALRTIENMGGPEE